MQEEWPTSVLSGLTDFSVPSPNAGVKLKEF